MTAPAGVPPSHPLPRKAICAALGADPAITAITFTAARVLVSYLVLAGAFACEAASKVSGLY